MDLILAGFPTEDPHVFCIGLNGKLPWKCKEELSHFKTLTMNSVLIMGRKTVETLPYLPDRDIVCVTKHGLEDDLNESVCAYDLSSAEDIAKSFNKKIFVAGGGEIYQHFLLPENRHKINKIHLSVMKEKTPINKSDIITKVKIPPCWVIETQDEFEKFTYLCLTFSEEEESYLSLISDIFKNGEERKTRNDITKSFFSKTLKFNLQNGFPLLTTKKMFFKGIVEELLFFIRGDTDSKLLEDKGVKIWKKNTERKFLDEIGKPNRKEGMMGPMYGYQWRYYNAKYDEETGKPKGFLKSECKSELIQKEKKVIVHPASCTKMSVTECIDQAHNAVKLDMKQKGIDSVEEWANEDNRSQGIDQLQNVIDLILKDPNSRRIILTDFNPCQAFEGVLYPCHSLIIQFYVSEGFLDMNCYNRSQDTMLGVPFNIASSALLLTLISILTNLKPRYLNMMLGDVHIYKDHLQHVSSQTERRPYKLPLLKINKEIKTLEDVERLNYSDFELKGYNCYPNIKMEMVA